MVMPSELLTRILDSDTGLEVQALYPWFNVFYCAYPNERKKTLDDLPILDHYEDFVRNKYRKSPEQRDFLLSQMNPDVVSRYNVLVDEYNQNREYIIKNGNYKVALAMYLEAEGLLRSDYETEKTVRDLLLQPDVPPLQ